MALSITQIMKSFPSMTSFSAIRVFTGARLFLRILSLDWFLAGGFLAWLCDIGITCLAALRSYTLFRLSGCVVKFSFFLLTFSAKIVFVNKILLSFRFYIARPSNSYLPLVNSPTVVLWCGRCAWRGVCNSTDASVL